MALSLVTNPVGSDTVKIFAGFQPCEFVFKREDLAITGCESGTGGVKITHAGDLSSYLAAGDSVYLYSEGTDYTYDGVGTVLSVAAGEVTIDLPFIAIATGGYINYYKNYYVEMQCVDPTYPDANLLPFSLQSDGDAAGNITIDVSIVNDLNEQRGAITEGLITESIQEFEVQYRQVYTGSGESFTLIDNKKIVLLYATEDPETEVLLNQFELPKIFLGYQAALVIANIEDAASSTLELTYNELDINNNVIASGTLGILDSDINGFLLWEWASDASIDVSTKYINFDLGIEILGEYSALEYDPTEYSTT